MDRELLQRIMLHVEKPARYMGNELNMVEKNIEEVDIRFAFVFPDVYEVGMSHLGMKILYHLINRREDAYCERVFAPWNDMEQKLREAGLPLFALETKDPINRFDMVGFTLQYEMTYTNILNILDLAGIPLMWKDRKEGDPFILAGGPCAYNAEPLADFLDIVVIGEGEEIIDELLDAYKCWKHRSAGRLDFLKVAARIPGIYVPRFYEPSYNSDGTIHHIEPVVDGVLPSISKRVIKDLNNAFYPQEMIVPYMEIVHDRIPLEIFRGCSRGCRFCQAGMVYRPVRERRAGLLLEFARNLIKNTGYDDISLLSLSSSDYSEINDLLSGLIDILKSHRVSLSLPSMRVDSFAGELIEQIRGLRRTGLTLAPEAGSQRLRDVINKGVSEQNFIDSVNRAFDIGWEAVKLYFMMGLPTETEQDLRGIADLVKRVKLSYANTIKAKRGGSPKIAVSVSSFVPKPFTPFQWVGQDSIEQLTAKHKLLSGILRIKGVEYDWNDPRLSFVEAVFARGDRRLGRLLISAWKNGCKFDGWSEHFRFDAWSRSFEETGIDPHFYAHRIRERNEVFPWEHIDIGVTKEFLLSEYQCALKGQITPDCRIDCQGCGVSSIKEGLC